MKVELKTRYISYSQEMFLVPEEDVKTQSSESNCIEQIVESDNHWEIMIAFTDSMQKIEENIHSTIEKENYTQAIELIDEMMCKTSSFFSGQTAIFYGLVKKTDELYWSPWILQKALLLHLNNQTSVALDVCAQLISVFEKANFQIDEAPICCSDVYLLQGFIELKTDEQAALRSFKKIKKEDLGDCDLLLLRALEKKLNVTIFPENGSSLKDGEQSVFLQISDLLLVQGNASEALKMIEDNAQAWEGDEDFQSCRANCLTLLGRYDEALEIYQCISDPENLDLDARGIILLMKGDYEEAKRFANPSSHLLLAIQGMQNR